MPVRQNIGVIRPFQVPLRLPTINWDVPITRGLIGLYVPGHWGGFDLTNKLPRMASGGDAEFGAGTEGRGLRSASTSGAGYSVVIGNGALFNPYVNFTNITLWTRFQVLGTPSASANIFGIDYDNASSSPFSVATIGVDGASNYRATWNSAGSFSSLTITGILSAPTIVTFCAAFSVGGNVTGYVNGTTNATAFVSAPTNTATSLIELGYEFNASTRNTNALIYIAGIWNRALSTAEMAQLQQNPYGFLIEKDTVSLMSTVAGAAGGFKPWFAQNKNFTPDGVFT